MGFGHRVYKNGDPRNSIIKVSEVNLKDNLKHFRIGQGNSALSPTVTKYCSP